MHQPNSRVLVGSEVVAFDDGYSIPVGPGILGRVVDALGQPLDGNMVHGVNESWPLAGESINPLNKIASKQSTRCWSENYKFITYGWQRSKTWYYCRIRCR